MVSKTEPTKKKKASGEENTKPSNKVEADADDFVKEKEKKVLKKKEGSATVEKPKKLGLKKKSATVEPDSDPDTNDIEAAYDNSHDLGKEILNCPKSSDAVSKAESLLDEIEEKPEIDDKLQKLMSVFSNCLGSKHVDVLNSQNIFTRIFQDFEEIIESGAITKNIAKRIAFDLTDHLEHPRHFNTSKTFESLQIEEDFDSICTRLMKISEDK